MGSLPDEFRTWKLLSMGVSLTEQETAPAVRLDWLLAIDGVMGETVEV